MADTNQEFLIFAVRLLFKGIKEGHVKFAAERMPETMKALDQVKFDDNGDPIIDTITGPVRALANAVYANEMSRLEAEAKEQEKNSPVHDLLGEPTAITEEVLKVCAEKDRFSSLAFDLFRETAVVLTICSHSYRGEEAGKGALARNQAICAGLLIRITKFMTAILQLISTADRGEVVLALNRCIFESATNLRYLILKNDDKLYDQFIRSGLGPERELYDIIHVNIKARSGKMLPIEGRMLRSIDRLARLAGLKIDEIEARGRWGGDMRERLKALGEETLYVSTQRIASHAVHGTWVDLVLHHLEEKENGFGPKPDWSPVDPRLLCPPCILVLEAARSYLEAFFGQLPELIPLYQRLDDLGKRIARFDDAHEQWFSARRTGRSETR